MLHEAKHATLSAFGEARHELQLFDAE